ncbi:MAG: hypothetical protein Q8N63_03980 [Nanoarchaeota archaeon]|nr:hypothetical protein [Nanoarchaeota archaeon]
MKQDSKKNLIIALISIFVIILAVFLIAFAISYSIKINSDDKIACTMEAKICPDGSAVGRNSSKNCEFDECPNLVNSCINLGCPKTSSSNEQQSNYIYAGSKNSDKYYECSCGYAKNILPENLVCFASDEDAIADGKERAEC